MPNWSQDGLNRNRRPGGGEAGLGAAALRGGKKPKLTPTAPAPAKAGGFRFPGGKRGALIAGGVAAAGGVGAGVHHQMRKSLVNPFEEVVAFGKAYPVALPVQRAVRVRALLPTGAHVSHVNDLHVIRHSGHGGRRAGLEHYSKGLFGRAAGKMPKFMGPNQRNLGDRALDGFFGQKPGDALRVATGSSIRAHGNHDAVQRGLFQAVNQNSTRHPGLFHPRSGTMPLRNAQGTGPSSAPRRLSQDSPLRKNSNIPDAGRQGRRIA